MVRRKMIQIQGSVLEPIGKITSDARMTVSKICLGIDDMQLLGNKALIFRVEISPGKLATLYTALASIGIKLNKQSLPDIETLQEEMEYPLSIQITSFSDDTDRRISIPKVPG
jgi:hypothetical protein